MKWENFDPGLSRLVTRFGQKSFDDEFVKLIWKEVQHIDATEFNRIVDEFIGNRYRAPLIQDFRTEVAKVREKNWSQEKRTLNRESGRAYKKIFDREDIKGLIRLGKEKLAGRVNQEDFDQAIQIHKNAVGYANVFKCKWCEDSGWVFSHNPNGSDFVTNCSCEGMKRA